MADALGPDRDLAEDARRLLVELDLQAPDSEPLTTDCRPPLDVVETREALEIVVDVPGVPPETLRVVVRRSTMVIVGEKIAEPIDPTARFHVAERSYGRFVRAVRLTGAFDAGRTRAVASAGELRVILPFIEDGRGRILVIPVERE